MKHIVTVSTLAAGLLFSAAALAQEGAAGSTPDNLSNLPVQSNDTGSRIVAHNQDVAANKAASAKSSNTTTAMADRPSASSGTSAQTNATASSQTSAPSQ